jgi:hypothetical protein
VLIGLMGIAEVRYEIEQPHRGNKPVPHHLSYKYVLGMFKNYPTFGRKKYIYTP